MKKVDPNGYSLCARFGIMEERRWSAGDYLHLSPEELSKALERDPPIVAYHLTIEQAAHLREQLREIQVPVSILNSNGKVLHRIVIPKPESEELPAELSSKVQESSPPSTQISPAPHNIIQALVLWLKSLFSP